MKISSIIGCVALFVICAVLILSGFFWFWPEATARITGFGPYDAKGIALYCALLVIAVGGIAWAIERVFERAGKTGVHAKWRSNQLADNEALSITGHVDEETSQLAPELIDDHLNLRYGRHWKRKIRILLVQGKDDDIEKTVPGK